MAWEGAGEGGGWGGGGFEGPVFWREIGWVGGGRVDGVEERAEEEVGC